MGRFVGQLRSALFEDGPILIGLGVVCTLLLALLARLGINGLHVDSYGENLSLYLFFLVMMSLMAFCRLLYRTRPDSPIAYLFEILRDPATARYFARGLPMLFALVAYVPIFSATKSAIPLFHAYNWDRTLITADRAIFGTDAWRLLQPMLGYPLVTSLLSYAYHAWVGLIYAGAIYFSFGAQDREVRARYFITFFTIWTVVGLALATGMASVGPCFVGPLLGYHEFDQLVAYLNAANEQHRVMVLPVQQELLAGYLTDARGLGQGIAAMPSMHVGLATLFALATWRINKLAGVLFTIFAAVIAVASVHLAYHYAVDGIVAAAVTIMTWAVAGPLAKRICGRSAASVQPIHPTGEAVAA